MAHVTAGIVLPDGDPQAADHVAATLDAAAGGFERTAAIVQRAVASAPSWQGRASINFADRCGSYEEAGRAGQQACDRATTSVRRYGADFKDAYERIERLQREAERCQDEIKLAERRATDAAQREQAARGRATRAMLSSPLDAGFSLGEQAAALREAEDGAADRRRAEGEADRARTELERLQKQAEKEHEKIREAGRQAALAVQAAQGELPKLAGLPSWALGGGAGAPFGPAFAPFGALGRSPAAAGPNVVFASGGGQAGRLPTGGGRSYVPPKGSHGNPQRIRGGGFRDTHGNEWKWAGGGQAHGGPHWDVQHPDGTHTNVDPDGEVAHGDDNFPNRPESKSDFSAQPPGAPSAPSPSIDPGKAAAGAGAATGAAGLIWWGAKLLSPACGPFAPACAVVL